VRESVEPLLEANFLTFLTPPPSHRHQTSAVNSTSKQSRASEEFFWKRIIKTKAQPRPMINAANICPIKWSLCLRRVHLNVLSSPGRNILCESLGWFLFVKNETLNNTQQQRKTSRETRRMGINSVFKGERQPRTRFLNDVFLRRARAAAAAFKRCEEEEA
jgi:hypothetical protein